MADMYREIILDLFHNPLNYGKVENPTGKAHLNNPLCGDEISMTCRVEKEVLKDVKFEGKGCALCMASASLLTDKTKNMKVEDILKLNKSDVIQLLQIEIGPVRLKCILLPLEAIRKALGEHTWHS